jgi:hypothetical protein
MKANLLHVERFGSIDVADGNGHEFELPIHAPKVPCGISRLILTFGRHAFTLTAARGRRGRPDTSG